jgi:hypothetical protein
MTVRVSNALSTEEHPKDLALRIIPSKGDLLSLGPPTITIQGMSLSQALEDTRDESTEPSQRRVPSPGERVGWIRGKDRMGVASLLTSGPRSRAGVP